jgi:hydroxyacylglutathione hydrolase
VTGDLDVRWIHGAPGEPTLQVHAYDDRTFILRQSKAVTFEAPFLFLLVGDDRTLLLDTGATKNPDTFPLRDTVDGLLGDCELIVAHTHSHGDHIAGDEQFAGRPRTTVVGTGVEDVIAFFGFSSWPDEVVTLDLGGRVLDVTGIPGHHRTSVAVFDHATGLLFTGDTVYPGRLYGFDMPQFVRSMDHLAEFAAARPVAHVLGCHIEMSHKPRRDYPLGTKFQPDEPPLQMTVEQIDRVRDASHAAARRPGVHVHDDFIVFNGTGRLAQLTFLARTVRQRILGW